MIERGIRTVSHSLASKSKTNEIQSTAAQEAVEEEVTGIRIKTLNKLLEQEAKQPQDLSEMKELRERWYTRSELATMEQNSGGEKSAATVASKTGLGVNTNFMNSPAIGQKTKLKELTSSKQQIDESNSSSNMKGADGYNVKRIYVS